MFCTSCLSLITKLPSKSQAILPDDSVTIDNRPIYSAMVPAGFPSPADDHLEGSLNLHEFMVRRPAATFFCRASGDSMREAGIHDGDIMVVDRSIEPHGGDVVVATISGELTVKRLRHSDNGWLLAPANSAYPSILIDHSEGIQVWGVVTYAITALCPR
jgi:DNA polymerase V